MTEGRRSGDNGWEADDQWARSLMGRKREKKKKKNRNQDTPMRRSLEREHSPEETERKRELAWRVRDRGREKEELCIEDEHGRRREARIPGEMERLQIRKNEKKERERKKELTYPGTASGILHTPPCRLHTHIHPPGDRGARRAAAETNQ